MFTSTLTPFKPKSDEIDTPFKTKPSEGSGGGEDRKCAVSPSMLLEIRDSQNLAKLGQGCTTRGGEGIEFRFNWRCG